MSLSQLKYAIVCGEGMLCEASVECVHGALVKARVLTHNSEFNLGIGQLV